MAAKPDAIALLMKTPPNKLKRPAASEEEMPAEDEEDGYDNAGAVTATKEFFKAGAAGDWAGAYEAFKNLKAICEAEEE